MRFTQFLMNGIPAHGPHMYFNANLVPKNFTLSLLYGFHCNLFIICRLSGVYTTLNVAW